MIMLYLYTALYIDTTSISPLIRVKNEYLRAPTKSQNKN
jgi:hypothetical protein